MNDLLNKLSSYNLFNNLLPGAVFCGAGSHFGLFEMPNEDIVTSVFIYYFVGLLIGRFGSLILEPILTLTKVIQYAKYEHYLAASKVDPKLEVMVETANTYRTMAALSVCLAAAFLVREALSRNLLSKPTIYASLLVSVTTLLIVSTRKQSSFIKKRVSFFGGS
jgi:hypothetical protein